MKDKNKKTIIVSAEIPEGRGWNLLGVDVEGSYVRTQLWCDRAEMAKTVLKWVNQDGMVHVFVNSITTGQTYRIDSENAQHGWQLHAMAAMPISK